MTDPDVAEREFTVLQAVISALQGLDTEARRRIFDTAATFFQIKTEQRVQTERASAPTEPQNGRPSYPAFSTDMTMSPKEFLFQKQPRSDVERIATLAYYLTHYREMPQFKTLDLSKLNTEAAQPKFSNAASSASNAVKRGYLVPTSKGHRQLSAAGERFIEALPDREAARAAMNAAQLRRKPRKSTAKKASSAPKAAVPQAS